MNKPLLAATALMALTVVAHIFGGGPQYLTPFQIELPNDELRSMAAVLWHAVSVSLIAFTLALGWMTRQPNRPLALTISALQLGWAGLFVFYGLTMLGNLSEMPQWSIFILVPALTWWGHRKV